MTAPGSRQRDGIARPRILRVARPSLVMRSVLRECLVAALLALLAGVFGCAEPLQQGGVIVLPGATERLLLAMRMGYAGIGDVKAPARAFRITSESELLAGHAASGRVGDYRIENQTLAVVITGIDGGLRGGKIVDLARQGGGGVDAIQGLETLVDNRRVLYTSLKTGSDQATSAAYVQAIGHPDGRPDLEVSTRYDLAPELETVLVHTSVTTRVPLEGPVALGDRLSFDATATINQNPTFVAGFTADTAYAFQPLVDLEAPPKLVSESGGGAALLGLGPESVPTGTFVYSRMLAPLERPDSLALACTLALASGDILGEVDVEVAVKPKSGAVGGGKLVFVRDGGDAARLELEVSGTKRFGDRVSAKVPAGSYALTYEGQGHVSAPTRVVVKRKQLATARLEIETP